MGGGPSPSEGLASDVIPSARLRADESCFRSTGGLRNAERWSGANPGLSHACRTLRASRALPLQAGSRASFLAYGRTIGQALARSKWQAQL